MLLASSRKNTAALKCDLNHRQIYTASEYVDLPRVSNFPLYPS